MVRYPNVVGNIKHDYQQLEDVTLYEVVSENQCKTACYNDEDCKIATWKNDPDGGICMHKRKDPMYDIQSVDVIHTLDKPDHVTFVKPECHERCHVSSNPSESPFIGQGVCTRWLCDHGSCGERKQKQYLDCRPCIKLAENNHLANGKHIQPSGSYVMKLRVTKDDMRLDFDDDETMVVTSTDAVECEQMCLGDPRCKVISFDTTDSSCLLKRVRTEQWLKDDNMNNIAVREQKIGA